MATSTFEIGYWFDEGVRKGATHLVVCCDTFDHDDYPVYVMPHEDVRVVEQRYSGSSMQFVMEVYNLRMDKQAQLNEHRAFNYDTPAPVVQDPKQQILCPPITWRPR